MALKKCCAIALLLMFMIFAAPSFAYAYLDPGAGSYIFQLLIAGLVGFLFVVAAYWRRFKAFFAGLLSRKVKAPPEDGRADDDA